MLRLIRFVAVIFVLMLVSSSSRLELPVSLAQPEPASEVPREDSSSDAEVVASGPMVIRTRAMGELHGLAGTPDGQRYTTREYLYRDWKLVEVIDGERQFSHLKVEHKGVLKWLGAGSGSEEGTSGGYFMCFLTLRHLGKCRWPEQSVERPLGDCSSWARGCWQTPDGRDTDLEIEDMTGRGGLTVIAYEWTGGAHAAYNYWILNLKADTGNCWCLNYMPLGNSELGLVSVESTGAARLHCFDDIFAYYYTGFAGSPFPEVELSFQEPAFEFDNKPLADQVIAEALNRTLCDDYGVEDLASRLTDFVWHGHIDEAGELVRRAPRQVFGENVDKSKWWADFLENARSSRFWDAMVKRFPALEHAPKVD
ncbi:MAG: hypothetical protein IT462_16615 [Planctomycetes bacterium]|nr:hypothetical protein [Planctomycetota bacterium]